MNTLWALAFLFNQFVTSALAEEFKLLEWKESGGLCAFVTRSIEGETLYLARSKSANQDIEYNFSTLQTFSDCADWVRFAILSRETLNRYLPDLNLPKFQNGFVVFDEGDQVRMCDVVALKSPLDLFPESFALDILRYVGQPLPEDFRSFYNSPATQKFVNENLAVICAPVTN